MVRQHTGWPNVSSRHICVYGSRDASGSWAPNRGDRCLERWHNYHPALNRISFLEDVLRCWRHWLEPKGPARRDQEKNANAAPRNRVSLSSPTRDEAASALLVCVGLAQIAPRSGREQKSKYYHRPSPQLDSEGCSVRLCARGTGPRAKPNERRKHPSASGRTPSASATTSNSSSGAPTGPSSCRSRFATHHGSSGAEGGSKCWFLASTQAGG
mmetsp:Transcript_17647/g.37791  ORF Transcript_17647/g.37791 Transcript_17647/m.37791 type:complete len:213 (+) Transcript_17647:609-1247(+)